MKILSRGAVAAVIVSLAVLGIANPASAAVPIPSIVMTCAKLQSATNPAAAFDIPVALHAPAVQDIYYSPWRLPDADIIRTAGGIECQWSNGGLLDLGPDLDNAGVLVQFLPGGEFGYDSRWWGPPPIDPVTSDCDGFGVCQLNSNVGRDYLNVIVDRARDDATALDLAERISAALQLGLQRTFTPPTYAVPLHHTCDQLIRPVAFRAAIRSSMPLVSDGNWELSVPETASRMAGGLDCLYSSADDTQTAGTMQTMPGGRWAFASLRSRLIYPGALTPMSVPGMRAGDAAFTRCDPGHSHCLLDALIATHWIEVELPPSEPGAALIRTDRLTAMRALLTELVLQVYTP